MRHFKLAAFCGGALILSSNASAGFTGLSVVSSLGAPEGRITYRVYADFSDPEDYLVIVFGNSASHMQIQSRNSDDSGVGGNFYNPANTNLAPTALQVFGGVDDQTNPIAPVPYAAFETFCTIGVADSGQAVDGDDLASLAPNSPVWLPFITGTSLDSDAAGWFGGPYEQGRAGYLGDGDPLLRVLIMQLTVTSTSNVRGTISVGGVNNTPLAGGSSFLYSGQTFNSVPAPGTLALLGLAGMIGLVGSRRRRSCPL
jgi:hypothetical protein